MCCCPGTVKKLLLYISTRSELLHESVAFGEIKLSGVRGGVSEKGELFWVEGGRDMVGRMKRRKDKTNLKPVLLSEGKII